jgi:peptide deformylase
MILEVLKYPDPRLREVSKPVTEFNQSLAQLASDMLETMYQENGVGLAAPQVGHLLRMLVVDTRPRDTGGRYEENQMQPLEALVEQPLVIINPQIVQADGSTTYDEGCLSVPSFYETVERRKVIHLKYNDVTGKECLLQADGLLSICIQHEMDHLEGTLFIDHLSFIKSSKIKNHIKKFGYPPKKSRNQEDAESEDSSENVNS